MRLKRFHLFRWVTRLANSQTFWWIVTLIVASKFQWSLERREGTFHDLHEWSPWWEPSGCCHGGGRGFEYHTVEGIGLVCWNAFLALTQIREIIRILRNCWRQWKFGAFVLFQPINFDNFCYSGKSRNYWNHQERTSEYIASHGSKCCFIRLLPINLEKVYDNKTIFLGLALVIREGITIRQWVIDHFAIRSNRKIMLNSTIDEYFVANAFMAYNSFCLFSQ